MRIFKVLLFALVMCGLLFPVAFAAGNPEKGEALFSDPKAFNGTAGKSCASCHPNGQGLENSSLKKTLNNTAGIWTSLEDAINVSIIIANKGKAIDPKSADMIDLIAYIKSLGKKAW